MYMYTHSSVATPTFGGRVMLMTDDVSVSGKRASGESVVVVCFVRKLFSRLASDEEDDEEDAVLALLALVADVAAAADDVDDSEL